MPRLSLLTIALLGALLSLSSAYIPQHQPSRPGFSLETASRNSNSNINLPAKIAAASAFVIANAPAIAHAVAEADDDYEYGAVDAPIGLAVGGGILAVATALLPVFLRGGEEAFEEMKDRDSDTFGKSNKDVLKGRK